MRRVGMMLLAAALGGLGGTGHALAQSEPPRPGVTFYASFDQGLEADYAAGSRAASIRGAGAPERVAGVIGQGVLVGDPNRVLFYDFEKNLQPGAGTLAMWVQPRDWTSEKGQFHVFLEGFGTLYVYFENGWTYWRAFTWDREQKKVVQSIARFNVSWQPGQWHHLAASWSEQARQIALYVDGEEVCRVDDVPQAVFHPDKMEFLSLGPAKAWDPASNRDETVIDEVYIFDSAVEPTVVRGLYDAGAEALGLKPASAQLPAAFVPDEASDHDGDGLSDLKEMQAMTDCFASDTDGDGLADAVDDQPMVHRDVALARLPRAEVRRIGGVPAMVIDGMAVGPMAYSDFYPGYKPMLRKLGQSGLRVQMVMMRLPAPAEMEAALTELDFNIRKALAAVPDAYVIVRVLEPTHAGYRDFYERFPGDVCYYADGEPAVYRGSHVYSYASQAWRNHAGSTLSRVINHMARQDYAGHLTGMQLVMGMTGEWWWWASEEINRRSIDHGPAMRHAFTQMLRQRYGDDVAKLRAAWGDPAVTFETAAIPTEQQRYRYADLEVFDPGRDRWQLDFLWCYNQVVTDTALYLAETIKAASAGRLLVGLEFEFGPHGYSRTGKVLTRELYSSDAVDFFSAPYEYAGREPGGHDVLRAAPATAARHNLLIFNENDMRTSLSKLGAKEEPRTIAESVEVLKRSFAQLLSLGLNGYWYVFGHLWYDDPAILAAFERMQRIGHLSVTADRQSHAQVALVYDEESLLYANAFRHTAAYLRYDALPRMGTPYDTYELADLLDPAAPAYRMYVMINVQCLDTQERRQLEAKAAREGATVVWVGVPGVVNPDRADAHGLAHIESLTGFAVEPRGGAEMITLTAEAQGVLGLEPGRPLASGPDLKRYFSLLAVEGASQVLGRYPDGRPGFVVQERGGWRSVLVGATLMDAAVLRGLARSAGVHLYSDSDDVLYAGGAYLALHTREGGPKRLELPGPADVLDLWEDRWLGEGLREITLDAQPHTTYLFAVGERGELEPLWRQANERFEQELRRREALLEQVEGKAPAEQAAKADGFLREFLFLGPFAVDPPAGRITHTPPAPAALASLERGVKPGEAVTLEGVTHTWRRVSLPFREHYGADLDVLDSGHSFYYVHTVVELEQAGPIRVALFADDWSELRLGDQVVRSTRALETLEVSLQGRAGSNPLLLRVYNSGGPTSFSLRLTDEQGRPLTTHVQALPRG